MPNNHKRKLLILEDDASARFVYDEVLNIRYDIEYAVSLKEFETKIRDCEGLYDLLIADLRLDDGSFTEYMSHGDRLAEVRVPFIVVSSFDDLDILRYCYDKGASDYLVKPFRKSELVVKVETAIERAVEKSKALRTRILPDNVENLLTPKEQKIFAVFLAMKGRSVSREYIMKEIWGSTYVDQKVLNVHLSNIKKKVDPLGFKISYSSDQKWVLTQKLSDGVGVAVC